MALTDRMIRDQSLNLPVPTAPQIKGKTFLVTGSNTGLGYEAAKHLVAFSAAKVILAVRSLPKGEAAKTQIEKDTGIAGVTEVWPLDMSSYDSIKAFATKVQGLERVDSAILNAALALDKWDTAEGLEMTLAVNVTGTMLLTGLLMPKMKETAKTFGVKTDIAIIGSEVAFTVPGELEKIDGDILEWLNDESNGLGPRYPVSKLVLWYTFRKYSTLNPASDTSVVVSYTNPGLCKTDLNRHVAEETKARINAMKEKYGRTAEMGSRTLLYGAIVGEEGHGQYLSECEAKEHYVPSWTTDESGKKIQERVWQSVSAHVNKASPGCL